MLEELNQALQSVYAHMRVLQDLIDNIPEEAIPVEHYVSLKDDVADLIVATISNNESEKLRLITLILKSYFTKSEREGVMNIAYQMSTEGGASD